MPVSGCHREYHEHLIDSLEIPNPLVELHIDVDCVEVDFGERGSTATVNINRVHRGRLPPIAM